ncbi:hypothetical protein [Mucilaginibacter antarcticus]|uniref:SLAC1 family transporter n=1 Tax=Mucilaginibacter antarcticus TaxID=1855725 RepID=UPI00363E5990
MTRTGPEIKSLPEVFPVSIFGSVMGLAGLSRAFRLAETLFGLSTFAGDLVTFIAVTAFILIAGIFLVKVFRFPKSVRDEFLHPSKGSFYATIPIAVLLMSTVVRSHFQIGYFMWCSGTVLMLALTGYTFYSLISRGRQQLDISPVLILPVVGVLNIAVTAAVRHTGVADEIILFLFL